ncbi:hypothetical protein, partial [Mobiluncus mulieris]|uniref:hypothetical protein n=1 Tax=Mobiluncus mulieris TaxID=2052 RepID=UPI003D3262DB
SKCHFVFTTGYFRERVANNGGGTMPKIYAELLERKRHNRSTYETHSTHTSPPQQTVRIEHRKHKMTFSPKIATTRVDGGLTVTERGHVRHIRHEDDAGYHHGTIDLASFAEWS